MKSGQRITGIRILGLHTPELDHKCILLRGSLYWYGQVRHREDNVQWIYNMLLAIQISSECEGGAVGRFNLTEVPTYVYTV